MSLSQLLFGSRSGHPDPVATSSASVVIPTASDVILSVVEGSLTKKRLTSEEVSPVDQTFLFLLLTRITPASSTIASPAIVYISVPLPPVAGSAEPAVLATWN